MCFYLHEYESLFNLFYFSFPSEPSFIRNHKSTYETYMNSYAKGDLLESVMGTEWFAYVKRPKIIAWMSGHCPTEGRREDYVEELDKYIDVDKYGSCGTKECYTRHPYAKECWVRILRPNYLFFLSMENALCNDYISEKLYNPLLHGIVPVVYGGKYH